MPGNNEDVTTRFRVDISDLKANISEANKQIQLANAQFRNATAGMDDWTKSADGLSAKIEQQNKIVEAEQRKLQALKDQLQRLNQAQQQGERIIAELTRKQAEAAEQFGENSEEAKEYARQLLDAQKAQDRNREAAERLNVQIINQDTAVKNAQADAERYENALNGLGNEVDEVDDSMQEATDGGLSAFGVAMANLAANVVSKLAEALADVVKGAIDTGKAFESSMSNVAAISGATAEELQLLEDTARKYGSTTQYSAAEAADALGYMALAGWDAQQSADALGGVLNLAASSGMELAEASDMVTDYISAFGMQADKSAYFADLLAYAQGNANTTAAGLGEAFGNCAATLNAGGQDIETTTALLSMMANQGLKGSEAGTALSAVMRDLTDHMENGAVQIGNTAVQVQDANGNYRDLTDILKDVENATNGLGDAEKAVALSSAFTSRSTKALNLILAAGVDEASYFEEQLRGASVSVDGFEEAANAAGIPVDELKKQLEDAGISADDFKDILKSSEADAELFVDSLAECANAGADVNAIFANMGISVEDLQDAMNSATGTAENMANIMNDNLEGDLKSLSSAYDELGITIFQSVNAPMRDIVQTVTNDVLPAFTDLVNGVDGAGQKVGEAVGNLINKVMEQATKLLPQVAEIGMSLIDSVLTGLLDSLPMVVESLAQMSTTIINALAELLPKIVLKIVDIVPQIIDALTNAIPMLLGAAIEFLTSIVRAIPTIIEHLAESIPKIIESIIDIIVNGIPLLIEGAAQLFTAIVEAIPKILPPLIAAVPQIISAIVGGLLGNIPVILKAAINLLLTIVKAIPQIVTSLIPQVFDLVEMIANLLVDNIPLLLETSMQLFGALIEAIPEIVLELIKAIPQIIDAIMQGLARLPDILINFFVGLWTGIKDVFMKSPKFFYDTFLNAWNNIKKIWDLSKAYFTEKWNGIKNIFSTVGTYFSQQFTDAWNNVKNAFSKVGEFFGGIWDTIKRTFSAIGTKVGDAIGGAFKTAINAVIATVERGINAVPNAINRALDLINALPGVNISHMPNISLPRLARGGIVNKPTLAEIGEDGTEAVLPLEKNKRGLRQIAQALAAEMQSGGTFGGSSAKPGGDTIYNFNQTNTSPKALSRFEIYRQTQNLINAVKVQGV